MSWKHTLQMKGTPLWVKGLRRGAGRIALWQGGKTLFSAVFWWCVDRSGQNKAFGSSVKERKSAEKQGERLDSSKSLK
jgi:hypothetical protein